jgi:uncharacterized membrane protein YphA (DoxX/SURF4 family)
MSESADIAVLIGRICFVAFFVNSAYGHVTNRAAMVGYARSIGMPGARFASWPSGVFLFAASAMVVLGVWADLGALLLAAFSIPTGYYAHRYWTIEDPQQRSAQRMNFFRNVTFVGAALVIFAFIASAGHGLDLMLTAPLFDLR